MHTYREETGKCGTDRTDDPVLLAQQAAQRSPPHPAMHTCIRSDCCLRSARGAARPGLRARRPTHCLTPHPGLAGVTGPPRHSSPVGPLLLRRCSLSLSLSLSLSSSLPCSLHSLSSLRSTGWTVRRRTPQCVCAATLGAPLPRPLHAPAHGMHMHGMACAMREGRWVRGRASYGLPPRALDCHQRLHRHPRWGLSLRWCTRPPPPPRQPHSRPPWRHRQRTTTARSRRRS
jgi:hypothetical protein